MKRFTVTLIIAFTSSLGFAAQPFFSTNGVWTRTTNVDCIVWNSYPKTNETVTWSGPITNGKACGHGVMQWYVDGRPTTKYEGDVQNGRHHGHGVYQGVDCIVEADWADGGVVSPTMKLTFPDNGTYVGEQKDGRMDGKGVLTFASGNWYKGQFKTNAMHGVGEELLSGGGRYAGDFAGGRFNGSGTYYYPNGEKLSGTWSNSVLFGTGTQTTAAGEQLPVMFKHGQLQRVGTGRPQPPPAN